MFLLCTSSFVFSKESVIAGLLKNNSEYLLKFIERPGNKIWSASKKLKEMLQSEDISNGKEKDFLKYLRLLDQSSTESIFLEDSVINTILISSILEPDSILRESIIDDIYNYCRPDYIKSNYQIIKKAYDSSICISHKFGILLILKMDYLSESQKKCLLNSGRLPDFINAMNGDSVYVKKMYDNFANAKDYRSIRKYAEYLGMLGTDTAVKLLLSKFSSNICDLSKTNSIRYPIMCALAHIFPQDSVFKNIRIISAKGEDRYALHYNKSNEEIIKINLSIMSMNNGINDVSIDYSVVKNKIDYVINWADRKYSIKIKEPIEKPYLVNHTHVKIQQDDFNKRQRPVNIEEMDTTKVIIFNPVRTLEPARSQ